MISRTTHAVLAAAVALPAALLAHPGHDAHVTHVAGQSADEPRVTIEVRDGYRHIESNGLPDHSTGQFPNRGNPNAISPQQHAFRVTTNPQPAEQREERGRQRPVLFGVALNGVVFDPGTAEIWRDGQQVRGGRPQPDDWRYEAIGPQGGTLGLDDSNAHVQSTGTYHYHGLPVGLIDQLIHQLGGDRDQMLLIGWAADGYPIYAPWGHANPNDAESPMVELTSSYALRPGPRPANGPDGDHDGTFTQDFEFVDGSGNLDAFNGRVGVTPEFPGGTFYYVITDAFPFIPRTHVGTPDRSFEKRGGGGDRGRRQRR